jgi:hypothetical protein
VISVRFSFDCIIRVSWLDVVCYFFGEVVSSKQSISIFLFDREQLDNGLPVIVSSGSQILEFF